MPHCRLSRGVSHRDSQLTRFSFRIPQPIALAFYFDQLRLLQEVIEDCRGCRNITNQFSAVFERPVARHHRTLQLVTPHDTLEHIFAGAFRKLFHSCSNSSNFEARAMNRPSIGTIQTQSEVRRDSPNLPAEPTASLGCN